MVAWDFCGWRGFRDDSAATQRIAGRTVAPAPTLPLQGHFSKAGPDGRSGDIKRETFVNRRSTAIACLVALGLAAAGAGRADAQADYPSRAITFLVPMAAGSGSDAVARVVAQYAQPSLGQPMVVENVPGAGGQIGTARVARADPDGYTVLLGSVTTHAANRSLFKKLSYDPVADFEPVAKLGTVALALVVTPSVPATNVRELIEYAKSHP